MVWCPVHQDEDCLRLHLSQSRLERAKRKPRNAYINFNKIYDPPQLAEPKPEADAAWDYFVKKADELNEVINEEPT